MFKVNTPSIINFSIYNGFSSYGRVSDYRNLPRPYNIVLYLHEGTCTYIGSSGTVSLNAGELLFIPFGETIIYSCDGHDDMTCTNIHFLFDPKTDPFANKKIPIQKISTASSNDIIGIINTLNDKTVKENKQVADFSTMSSFYHLCDLVLSSLSYTEVLHTNTQILPAINYILKNYKENFSVEFLADLCFLSKSHFCHLFKEIIGVPPIAYKNQLIVNYAIQSLESDPNKTLEEISEGYGYTPTYLRKMIKNFTGKTPSEIKKCTRI